MTPSKKRGRPPGTDYAHASKLLGMWQARPETRNFSNAAMAKEIGCSLRSIYRYLKLLKQTNELQYSYGVISHDGKRSIVRKNLDFSAKLDYRPSYLRNS